MSFIISEIRREDGLKQRTDEIKNKNYKIKHRF